MTLGKKNVGSLPSLIEMIRKTRNPKPVKLMLEETIDMQIFIMGLLGEERCIEKLNDIFQHQFCIRKIDGKTLLWGKKYTTSVECGPTSGLTSLKFIPICQIYASKLLLLQSTVEIQNACRHNRDVDSPQCLEEIKKSIKHTYDYFDVVDIVWWESFFMEKNDIISNYTNRNIFF